MKLYSVNCCTIYISASETINQPLCRCLLYMSSLILAELFADQYCSLQINCINNKQHMPAVTFLFALHFCMARRWALWSGRGKGPVSRRGGGGEGEKVGWGGVCMWGGGVAVAERALAGLSPGWRALIIIGAHLRPRRTLTALPPLT